MAHETNPFQGISNALSSWAQMLDEEKKEKLARLERSVQREDLADKLTPRIMGARPENRIEAIEYYGNKTGIAKELYRRFEKSIASMEAPGPTAFEFMATPTRPVSQQPIQWAPRVPGTPRRTESAEEMLAPPVAGMVPVIDPGGRDPATKGYDKTSTLYDPKFPEGRPRAPVQGIAEGAKLQVPGAFGLAGRGGPTLDPYLPAPTTPTITVKPAYSTPSISARAHLQHGDELSPILQRAVGSLTKVLDASGENVDQEATQKRYDQFLYDVMQSPKTSPMTVSDKIESVNIAAATGRVDVRTAQGKAVTDALQVFMTQQEKLARFVEDQMKTGGMFSGKSDGMNKVRWAKLMTTNPDARMMLTNRNIALKTWVDATKAAGKKLPETGVAYKRIMRYTTKTGEYWGDSVVVHEPVNGELGEADVGPLNDIVLLKGSHKDTDALKQDLTDAFGLAHNTLAEIPLSQITVPESQIFRELKAFSAGLLANLERDINDGGGLQSFANFYEGLPRMAEGFNKVAGKNNKRLVHEFLRQVLGMVTGRMNIKRTEQEIRPSSTDATSGVEYVFGHLGSTLR
jgi:hypothetical protein